MRSENSLILALFAYAILLSGCSEDSDDILAPPSGPHPGGSSSAIIGAAGGNVNYGSAFVIIPVGALLTNREISVEIPESEPSYISPGDVLQIGYVYETGPIDTEFSLSLSIVFTYEDDDIDPFDESTISIWSFDEAGDTLAQLSGIYLDTQNNTVSGMTPQLSYFLMTVSTSGVWLEPPSVPELIAPYDGMTDNRLSITFRWESPLGADYYHIQVAHDADFSSMHYDEPGITGNIIGLAGFEPYSTYYWRIQPRNDYGTGDWSEVWSFSTNDGSGTGTIEGTWEFDWGEAIVTAGPDTWTTLITSSGNLILSLGNGYCDVEGVIDFVEGDMYFPMEHEYYSFEIDHEGVCSIINDSLIFIPDYTIHPEMTTRYLNYNYQVIADTLVLTREVWYTTSHFMGPEVTYYLRI